MPKISPIILFAGPSLTGKARSGISGNGIQLHSPVQRNDIYQLLDAGFNGTLAIADGVFHQVVAVGHAEIRTAIESGCQVFGLSSMGAIRAYEMRYLGMRGYGEVYNWFFKLEDFQDDELALFHFPAPSYRPVTEPMVHFRVCLEDLKTKNILTSQQEERILHALKSRYYGERTMRLFSELLEKYCPAQTSWILNNFENYRIKSRDLEQFIDQKIWKWPDSTNAFP